MGSFIRRFDYIQFGLTIVLIVFGILMIRSATLDAVDTELISRVPDQIQFAVIGIIALLLVAALDYRLLGGLHLWLYIIMVVLLLMVQFLGVEGDAGAQRWVNLGIRVQPSEVGKIIIIITLSQFLASNYKQMDRFSTVIRSLIHLALPAGLIFIQPDLGMTIVFAVLWAALVWGAGIRMKHVFLLLFIAISMVPISIQLGLLQPYQLERLTTFLDRSDDEEATFGNRYNIEQALISIGSGGFVGKGYAAGSQNTGRFLRVRHTDFIFSVIAHEFGFAGSLAIIGAFGIIVFRILHIARMAADPLGSLICYGVATMIFFQTFVSIGMNISLLPVTGLTLPLVSSGGTSLLFTMIGLGLVQSVAVRRRRLDY